MGSKPTSDAAPYPLLKHSFVRQERPKADIRNNHYCCDAASLQRTLIERAAFAPPEEIWVILFADTARLNS